ncbi:hypothetical protein ABB37_09915 [Leptomonas pyrrhocoris]|uniref:Uncharacterized protein n=1 Tax=Leptomonas pyrrhocoris TaxID=157538 RepID=A0A0M9FPD5_LEPPY|nr:hypothetical protein ABB37_09915 [Leptomonas pyrrhocoris]KPA73360.1 hypothetical protein ABB37_09915 [Leptomonas pyrrhocoris]|eukprot:XP_015651799.1 hypothetical protein ABB37_09915 [Leptomonas pyrrhocoris]
MDGLAVAQRPAYAGRAIGEADAAAASSASPTLSSPSSAMAAAATARTAASTQASLADRSRAWTAGFHQLAQDYEAQLTQLVDAYARVASGGLALGGKADTADGTDAAGAAAPLLSPHLRRRGLGGDAREDAALALDMDDLRRAERELLLQLQARQRASQRAKKSAVPKQRGRPAATSTAEAPGVAGAAAHRSSTQSSRTTQDKADGTAAVDAAEAPPSIPEEVMNLFRRARQRTAAAAHPDGDAEKQDATNAVPSAAGTKCDGDAADAEEATALARLCVKYFFASATTPPLPTAPAAASPPQQPQQPDQSWSPPGRRRSSREGFLQSNAADLPSQQQQQQQQQQRRRRGEKASSLSLIDSSIFPPPDLHPHTAKPKQQHQQQRSLHHSSSLLPGEAGSTTGEGSISISLSSPTAWRKLIDKRTTAAATAADHGQLSGISPSTTARAPPMRDQPGPLQGAALPSRDGSHSAAFPPPRSHLTASTTSEAVERMSSSERDDPLGGRRDLHKPAQHPCRSTIEQAQRLPALHRCASPANPADATTAAPADAPSHHSASTPPHAAQQGAPSSSLRRLPRVPHAGGAGGKNCGRPAGVVPLPPPAAAPRATSQPAKVTKRHTKGLQALPVELPPHYHGVHGEALSTAELERLVKTVAREGEAAQGSLDRTYHATDTAAAALYALQQSLAHVLLENVQLEKDIATLRRAPPTTQPPEGVRGDAKEAAAEEEEREETTATSPALMPPPVRHTMFALPAPTSSSAAAAAFSSALFTNASHGPKAQNTSKTTLTSKPEKMRVVSKGRWVVTPANTATAAATTAAVVTMLPLPDAVERRNDALAVLEELRAAAAAREAENAQTLVEIDALSTRIARHDALLQAIAEYWRRNAAVMKRQQFAVQAQPKTASGPAVSWQSGTGGSGGQEGGRSGEGRRASGRSSSSPSSSSSRLPSSTSGVQRSGSSSNGSSVNQTEASVGMPTLLESPSQVERALADMEAVSPMLPSSAVSFDLHCSPSRTTDNSSAPPTVRASKQVTVRQPPYDAAATAGEEQDDVQSSEQRSPKLNGNPNRAPHHHHHHHPPQQQQPHNRTQRAGVLSDSSFPSCVTSSGPTTLTGTTGATVRTLFSSPESASESDSDGVERPQPSASTVNAIDSCGKGKEEDAAEERHGNTLATEDSVVTSSLQATNSGMELVVSGQAVKPIALAAGSAASQQHESHPRPTAGSYFTSTSASRRGEEEVLQVGCWRTIPALQLEKVDEIAEFIYSVFERA